MAGDTANEDVFIYDMRATANKIAARTNKLVSLGVDTSGGDQLSINWGDGTVDRLTTSREYATSSIVDHAYGADGRYTATLASTRLGGATSVSNATVILGTEYTGHTLLNPGFDGPANNAVFTAGLSANGRYAVLLSTATNLVAGFNPRGQQQFYLKDTVTGDITPVSTDVSGQAGGLGPTGTVFVSNDGSRVIFQSSASYGLTDPNISNDVFSKNMTTGVVTALSTTAGGLVGNGASNLADVSPDGQFVVFASASTNLTGSDTNGNFPDVFLKNSVTGAIQMVSVTTAGAQAFSTSNGGAVSANGRYVAFNSFGALQAGDTNATQDVYLRDTQTNTTTRVSLGVGNAPLIYDSNLEDLSADGSLVLFTTIAPILPADPFNIDYDLYLRNVATGALTLVSVAADGVTSPGQVIQGSARMSADNRYVTFSTNGSFDAGDVNASNDVFRKDLQTGALLRISSAGGVQGGNEDSQNAFLSDDGQTILFLTRASDLTGPLGNASNYDSVLWRAGGGPAQVLNGTPGIDIVQGSQAADLISTFEGDDSIFAYRGNDTVDGGGGFDTFNLSGNFQDYTLSTYGSKISLGNAADGNDVVRNVERLQFANGAINKAVDPYVDAFYYNKRYIDIFNGGADAGDHYNAFG